MSSLTQILLHAGSGEASLRDPATAQLDAFEKGDFAQYVAALCGEFGSEERQREVRLLAALQLKNALIRPKNVEQSLRLAERWLRLPETIRTQAKNMILQTLASRDESVRSQAARVVAAVASIEVPKQQWNDIINILVQSIIQTGNDGLRQAGFEALGYVCEEVPEYLQTQSNVVLNAIAVGLHPDLKDTKIKLAATRALVNSMNFVKDNFRIPAERDTIMRMIYSVATYKEDVNVRVAAFSALVEVASSYYEYLSQFIAEIYVLTSNAMVRYEVDTKIADTGTFIILKEDHTLGNIVRHSLLRDRRVLFAGYRLPHPLDFVMQIKIRTVGGVDPIAVMDDTCDNLKEEIKKMAESFQQSLQEHQQLSAYETL